MNNLIAHGSAVFKRTADNIRTWRSHVYLYIYLTAKARHAYTLSIHWRLWKGRKKSWVLSHHSLHTIASRCNSAATRRYYSSSECRKSANSAKAIYLRRAHIVNLLRADGIVQVQWYRNISIPRWRSELFRAVNARVHDIWLQTSSLFRAYGVRHWENYVVEAMKLLLCAIIKSYWPSVSTALTSFANDRKYIGTNIEIAVNVANKAF